MPFYVPESLFKNAYSCRPTSIINNVCVASGCVFICEKIDKNKKCIKMI